MGCPLIRACSLIRSNTVGSKFMAFDFLSGLELVIYCTKPVGSGKQTGNVNASCTANLAPYWKMFRCS